MAGMAQTPTPATAGMSPAEALIVAALVAVIGASLLTWLGAALAAVLVGAPPPGGVADAVGAIPGLVSTPGDPTGAWSAAVGRPVRLPPAGIYWAATVTVAVTLLACWWWRRGRLWRTLSPTRRRLGVDAHARFATRRELRPLLVKAPTPGRFVLGTWGRWLVATENLRWAPNRKRGLAPLVGARHRRDPPRPPR